MQLRGRRVEGDERRTGAGPVVAVVVSATSRAWSVPVAVTSRTSSPSWYPARRAVFRSRLSSPRPHGVVPSSNVNVAVRCSCAQPAPNIGRPGSHALPSLPTRWTPPTASWASAGCTPCTSETRSTAGLSSSGARASELPRLSPALSSADAGVTVRSATVDAMVRRRLDARLSVNTIEPATNATPSSTATVHSANRSRCARTLRPEPEHLSSPPGGRASSRSPARCPPSGRPARRRSRPSARNSTRSAYEAAAGSWVTITTVWPKSRTERRRNPSTSAADRESRFRSARRRRPPSGRVTSARATGDPLLLAAGQLGRPVPSRSRRPIVSITVSKPGRSGLRPARLSGSVMFSWAVSVGSRLNGWNTKPIRSRRSRVSALSRAWSGPRRRANTVAGGRPVQPGQAVQQRRLAGAGRPHDRGVAAALEVRREVRQGVDPRLSPVP